MSETFKTRAELEAIAQKVADESAWAKHTDNYARIYQAAWRGADLALADRARVTLSHIDLTDKDK